MINKRAVFAYLDTLIIVILIVIVLRSYYFLVFLILWLLIPIFSYVLCKLLVSKISVSVSMPETQITRKEKFTVIFRISNPSFIPSVSAKIKVKTNNAFFNSKAAHTLDMPVKAHKSSIVTYPLVSSNCGVFELSAEYITVSDITGIFNIKKELNINNRLLIMPVNDNSTQLTPAGLSMGVNEAFESKTKGNDFSEVTDVREYIQGDRMADIHWKLSAKKDDLMIKERSAMSAKQLVIVPELWGKTPETINRILDETFGICEMMKNEKTPLSVMWWSVSNADFKLKKADNDDEIYKIFEEIFFEKMYNEALARKMLGAALQGTGSYLMIEPDDSGKDGVKTEITSV